MNLDESNVPLTNEVCDDCGHKHGGVEVAHICIGCPCETRPEAPK